MFDNEFIFLFIIQLVKQKCQILFSSSVFGENKLSEDITFRACEWHTQFLISENKQFIN